MSDRVCLSACAHACRDDANYDHDVPSKCVSAPYNLSMALSSKYYCASVIINIISRFNADNFFFLSFLGLVRCELTFCVYFLHCGCE